MWAKGHGLGSCSHVGKIGACCVQASWGGQRALSQKQGAELASGYGVVVKDTDRVRLKRAFMKVGKGG